MKWILMPLLLIFTLHATAGDLQLTLKGKGIAGKNLYVAVHSSPEDFPVRDARAIKSAIVAKADATELFIPNVPKGEYAIAVFADINGNGELDSNFIGIPNEPVGISRDAKGKFGPPKFSDAAFKVGEGSTALSIELK